MMPVGEEHPKPLTVRRCPQGRRHRMPGLIALGHPGEVVDILSARRRRSSVAVVEQARSVRVVAPIATEEIEEVEETESEEESPVGRCASISPEPMPEPRASSSPESSELELEP